jgi:hypothetical protein
MKFYFWVKETDKHDEELEIIIARNLTQAKKEFAGMHPDDVNNIDSISYENGELVE